MCIVRDNMEHRLVKGCIRIYVKDSVRMKFCWFSGLLKMNSDVANKSACSGQPK
ncbi:unnamed protein product [Pylaiella littoralis]